MSFLLEDRRFRPLVTGVTVVGLGVAILSLMAPPPVQFLPGEEAMATFLVKDFRRHVIAAQRATGLTSLLEASRAQAALRVLRSARVVSDTAKRIAGEYMAAMHQQVMQVVSATLAAMPSLSPEERASILYSYRLGN